MLFGEGERCYVGVVGGCAAGTGEGVEGDAGLKDARILELNICFNLNLVPKNKRTLA